MGTAHALGKDMASESLLEYWAESDFKKSWFIFSARDTASREYSYQELEEAIRLELGFSDTQQEIQEMEQLVRASLARNGKPAPKEFGILGLFFNLTELREKGSWEYDDDRSIQVIRPEK
jgi:hypothetical protein